MNPALLAAVDQDVAMVRERLRSINVMVSRELASADESAVFATIAQALYGIGVQSLPHLATLAAVALMDGAK